MIQKYKNFEPQVDESCYIAPGSVVVGEVIIGKNSSVWYHVVIRGDIAKIEIGENTNIQDGSIIHCKTGIEVKVGKNVTVGHGVILHSCNIDDGCLIGMGAIILDGVKIEKNCLIAAGTLVTPNTIIQEGSLVMGNPGKVKRELTSEEITNLRNSAGHYLELAKDYK